MSEKRDKLSCHSKLFNYIVTYEISESYGDLFCLNGEIQSNFRSIHIALLQFLCAHTLLPAKTPRFV